MKQIIIAICCCLFLVGIAAADAPHFTALCADLNSANATLGVTFKAAGVGNEPVDVTLADEIRAIIEPGRLLSAREIMERVFAYYGCADEAHPVISEKTA